MSMKSIRFLILCTFLPWLCACSHDDEGLGDGEGAVSLRVRMEDYVKVATRALTDEEQATLQAGCKVRIYNSEGLVRKYNGLSEVPDEVVLAAGAYTLRVAAGDSVAASFDKKFFRYVAPLEVTAGNTQAVEVVCPIANTLFKVNFAESLAQAVKEYKVTISTSAGSLEYTQENADATGYFMLPEGEDVVKWSFSAKTLGNADFTRNGELNASPTTLYDLTFSYEENSDYSDGGAKLTLDVNATPLEENTSTIDVYQRPKISGTNLDNQSFDIDVPQFMEPGHGKNIGFWIATSSILTNARMSCPQFVSAWGLPVNDFDLLTMSSEERTQLEQLGVTITSKYNVGTGQGNMRVLFSDARMQQVATAEGSYDIVIYAKDQQGKERTSTLHLIVSDATVITLDAEPTDVWSSKAVLRGSLTKETSETLGFRYRKQGTTTWTQVTGTLNGNMLSASVTGLSAATTYEYQAMAGSSASAITKSFTTEKKAQLENGGFENWTDGTPMLLYGSGQSMYWDSGNHGSSKMSKNITTYDGTLKHSGNYSAKLASQFVGLGIIGKFAAGNAFVGKYLDTDGTDGILGFGREFHSRPKALHGYIRYVPGTVAYDSSSAPDLVKGENDKGQIYIAVGDWAGESYGNETWPVIIKTKNAAQLFDHNSPSIIGYGQQTWDTSTEGDGMVEFTIPLDYRVTDRKPTALVLVASASKYGDYFAGGPSTMWLDDLELIYE